MMSPFPWKIDPEQDDAGFIRDANNEIIAEDFRFLDLDDFEGIPELVNRGVASPVHNQVSQPGDDGSGGPQNAEGLLPCPFCGSDEVGFYDDDPSWMWFIKCKNCITTQQPTLTKSQAIENWNTRGGVRF